MVSKFRNGISYSLMLNFLNVIFPVMSIPVVLRAFSTATYGEYVLANVVYQLVNALFVVSLIQYYVREYSSNSDSTSVRINSDTPNVNVFVAFQVMLTAFSLSVYLFVSIFLLVFSLLDIWLFLLFLIPVLFSSVNVDWYFYAHRSYRGLFFRNLVIKLILLALIVVFVNAEEDLYVYAALMSAAYTFGPLSGFTVIRKKIDPLYIFSYSNFRNDIIKVKNFMANASIGLGYQYLDQIIIGVLLSKGELAALSILKQILSAAVVIPATVCRYWLPQTVSSCNSFGIKTALSSNVKRYAFLVTIVILGVLIFGYPILVAIATDKYGFKYGDIVICALCITVTSVSIFIDSQINVPTRLEKVTTINNAVVLSAFMMLIFPLTLALGYSGPIASLFLAEASGVVVMLVIHTYVYKTFSSRS